MFAITLDVVFTCAKMLHLNSHYHDMDAFVPTNMGLMDLSLKRDFPLFYYLFSSSFLAPSCIRVSYSACLHSGEIKDAVDRVHRRPANSRSYWRSLAFLFNDDEPAIAGLVVEPAIEQVHFNQHRCQTKDIQKQQPAWAMSED